MSVPTSWSLCPRAALTMASPTSAARTDSPPYTDTPPPPDTIDTPPPYYGSVEYELSEHGSMSDPRRFSAGFLQEIGYLDEGMQRTKCPRVASPVPFAGPDLDGAEEPAKAFAELRRRAEMATKEAAEAVAAAAIGAGADGRRFRGLLPHLIDRHRPIKLILVHPPQDYGSGLLPLPLHPELGGSGPCPRPDRLAPLYDGQRVRDGALCFRWRQSKAGGAAGAPWFLNFRGNAHAI